MTENKITYLSIADFNLFVKAIPKLNDLWKLQMFHRFPLNVNQFQLLCKLMFYCALKRNEIVLLTKNDFNLEKRVLTIPKASTHKKETTIPPNIIKELSTYLETLGHNEKLFPVSEISLWRYVKIVGEMANLDGLSKTRKKRKIVGAYPLLFRDSYRKYMSQLGADEDLIDLKMRSFSGTGYGGYNIENLKNWESENCELEYLSEPEGQKIEFKSTFSFNFNRFKNGEGKFSDPSIEKEVSIAIAAMANAEGGRLYIGVRDDGKIMGLDDDFELMKRPNDDYFSRQVLQSIRNHIKDQTN